MNPIIIGIDPSSAKLAVVVLCDSKMVEHHVKMLPAAKDKVDRCVQAYSWMYNLSYKFKLSNINGSLIHTFLESPVLGRGGPGSTIPQSQVGGACMAALGATMQVQGGTMTMVNNQKWKSSIVGIGNCSKEDVAVWVKDMHPDIYRKFTTPRGKIDQDLCDAFCIAKYGEMIARFQQSIVNPKKRVLIRRRPVKRG
jgi:hypothetical protein